MERNILVLGIKYYHIQLISDANNPMLHQSNFDFNDDLIELGAGFWWEIAKDRLLIWITYIAFIVNLMSFLTLKIDQPQVKVSNNNLIM